MAILIGLWIGGRATYSLYAEYGSAEQNSAPISTTIVRSFEQQVSGATMQPLPRFNLTRKTKRKADPNGQNRHATRFVTFSTNKQGSIGDGDSPNWPSLRSQIFVTKKADLNRPPPGNAEPLPSVPADTREFSTFVPTPSNLINVTPPTYPLVKPTQKIESIDLSPRFAVSGSAWLLWRRNAGQSALASNGQLAGSQAGARLTLERVHKTHSLKPIAYARITAPISRTKGKEGAIGVGLRTSGKAPLEITLERRHRLDKDGRSAWALGMSGGFYALPIKGKWHASGYSQAGVVGKRSRDLYVEGAGEVKRPFSGKIEMGIGLWASNQPRLHRLDIGPLISAPFAVGKNTIRFSGQWRFRVAGNAKPDSGPAITLGTDF